jgi:hypothetical protein
MLEDRREDRSQHPSSGGDVVEQVGRSLRRMGELARSLGSGVRDDLRARRSRP